MFKTILLPSDFSGCSAEAARAARLLAECFGSRLIVLHVLDEPAALDPMFRGEVPLELLRGRMEQYAREGMDAFLKAHFEGLPGVETGRSSAKPGRPVRG
jgi:nucleotide-binding universal stress UspA family protein